MKSALLLLLVLAGCSTVPTMVATDDEALPTRLSTALSRMHSGSTPTPASAAFLISPELATASVGMALDPASAEDGGAALRAALVDAGLVDQRVAERLRYLVLQIGPAGGVGYVEMDTGRLAASLALHWSGWEREDWGRWREPGTGARVDLRSGPGWDLEWGERSALGPPDRQLLARVMAEATGSGLIWLDQPVLAGFPRQVQPLGIAATDRSSRLVTGAARLPDERLARIALVAARLALPQLLAGGDSGLELDGLQRDGPFLIGSIEGLSIPEIIQDGGRP